MVLQAIIPEPRQFIDTPCAGLGCLGEIGIHPAELKDASCGQIKLHGPPREIKRNRTLGDFFSKPEVVMIKTYLQLEVLMRVLANISICRNKNWEKQRIAI